MKCVQCGGQLGPIVYVDMPYDSLPGTLLLGVASRTCAACGDVLYTIPRLAQLDLTIAEVLITKPTRLAGPEVRFLRKYLGWSGRDFASRVGATPETVSRWEHGTFPICETADKLLRMFFVHEQPVENYSLDQFEAMAKGEGAPVQLRLAADRAWHQAA